MNLINDFLYELYQPTECYSETERAINPKGFLANERTFLSWLHFSIILLGVSLGLLNFANSKTGLYSSLIFVFAAILVMFYSWYCFRWRANKLRNRDFGFYDDKFGPLALITLVFAAVSINFLLEWFSRIL